METYREKLVKKIMQSIPEAKLHMEEEVQRLKVGRVVQVEKNVYAIDAQLKPYAGPQLEDLYLYFFVNAKGLRKKENK